MAGEIYTTIIGNAVQDPELRFTPSGAAVINFTVASTPRHRDGSGEWVDDDTTFVRVSAWREHAEHIAESIRKGDRVVCHGRLSNRPYTATINGEEVKRTSLELDADEVSASLRFRSARITRPARAADVDREERRLASVPEPVAV